MTASGGRPEKLIREEIEDLTRYLDQIPKQVQGTVALAPYYSRLELLRQELRAALVVEDKCPESVPQKVKDESGRFSAKWYFSRPLPPALKEEAQKMFTDGLQLAR